MTPNPQIHQQMVIAGKTYYAIPDGKKFRVVDVKGNYLMHATQFEVNMRTPDQPEDGMGLQ